MIQRLYRKFRQRQAIRHYIQDGLLEVGERVTFSPDFQLKLQGDAKPQLKVGSDSHLAGRFVVRGAGRIVIGNHCHFHEDSYFGSIAEIRIGDSVFAAEGIFIVDNNNHPVDAERRRAMTLTPMGSALWHWTTPGVAAAPVVIEDNVWLGRNCVVMKGVRVGAGSIVALGAIVTKGGPPMSVLAGNPARVVRLIQPDPPPPQTPS